MEFNEVYVVEGNGPSHKVHVLTSRQPSLIRDHEQGIRRSEIYFCRTNGVPESEYEAIIAGFERIINETGRTLTLKNFGAYTLNNDPYGSPDWYQTSALTRRDKGFGTQVSAAALDELLRNEPFQKQNPHYDVMIVDRDLTTMLDDTKNNFIFGYGPYPNNIISVKRFMRWFKDPALRQVCLAVIGAHEFGHNLELVRRSYDLDHGELREGHCSGRAGPCVMEQTQVEGRRTIDEQARLLVEQEHWLCDSCIEEIYFRKEALQKRGISW